MTTSRTYNEDELKLLHNITLTALEVSKLINVHPITVGRFRKKHGIKSPRGWKPGPRPSRLRQVSRMCIGENCVAKFTVQQSSKKKYCSKSCQMRTVNNAPKGLGSRTIRNPHINEYKKYARLVHALSHKTYLENLDIINPNRYPRTLCGIENGWQLDHIIPIKECFIKGLTAEEASAIQNLRMLPWKENLLRQYE